MYRARRFQVHAYFESDALVFLLPFVLAIIIQLAVVWFGQRDVSILSSFGFAILGEYLGMVVAVNAYGE